MDNEWDIVNKWDIVMLNEYVFIQHTDINGTHLFSPGSLGWQGSKESYKWLESRKAHWGNINCRCGHWNKIPRTVIECFIATINLLRSAGC